MVLESPFLLNKTLRFLNHECNKVFRLSSSQENRLFFFNLCKLKYYTGLKKKVKDSKIKFWNPPFTLNFPYKCKRLKLLIFSSHKLMALKCSLTGSYMGVWLVNKEQTCEWQAEKFTVSIKPMKLTRTCTWDQTLKLEKFYFYSFSDIFQLRKITVPHFKWSREGCYVIGLLVGSGL